MFSTTVLFGALSALVASAVAAPVAPLSHKRVVAPRDAELWHPTPPAGVNSTIFENPTDADIDGSSDRAKWQLMVHNLYRAQFDAPPLVWNATLAEHERKHTSTCIWEHDGLGNLSGWKGAVVPNVDDGIGWWIDEYKDTKRGDLNHFTMSVWKDATDVGCAWRHCPTGQFPEYFYACSYSSVPGKTPPNMMGDDNFDANVGKLNGKSLEQVLAENPSIQLFSEPAGVSGKPSSPATASATASATPVSESVNASPTSVSKSVNASPTPVLESVNASPTPVSESVNASPTPVSESIGASPTPTGGVSNSTVSTSPSDVQANVEPTSSAKPGHCRPRKPAGNRRRDGPVNPGMAWIPSPPAGVNSTITDIEPSEADIAGTSDISKWTLQYNNLVRAQFDAPPVVWNATLAEQEKNHVGKCVWEHAKDGLDNLAAVSNPPSTSPEFLNTMWVNEYPNTKPGETNHFTILVWKDVASIGCAWRHCGSDLGWFYGCRYHSPPGKIGGNLVSALPEMVGKLNNKSKEQIIAENPDIVSAFSSQPGISASESASASATATGSASPSASPTVVEANAKPSSEVKPTPADPSDPDYSTLPECPDDIDEPLNGNTTVPTPSTVPSGQASVKPTPADPSDPDYSTLPECPDDIDEPQNGGSGTGNGTGNGDNNTGGSTGGTTKPGSGTNTGGSKDGANGTDGGAGQPGKNGANGADGDSGSSSGGSSGGSAKPSSGGSSGGETPASTPSANPTGAGPAPTGEANVKPTPADPSDPDYSTLPECPDDVDEPQNGGGSGGSTPSASATPTSSGGAAPTGEANVKPTPADPSDPDYSSLPECPDNIDEPLNGGNATAKPTPADPSDPDYSSLPECPDDVDAPLNGGNATAPTTTSEEPLPTGNGYSDPNVNVSVQKKPQNGTLSATNGTSVANATASGSADSTATLPENDAEYNQANDHGPAKPPAASASEAPVDNGGSGFSNFWAWVQQQDE